MEYNKIAPNEGLKPFIHFYWELKDIHEKQWERVFPDGCAGVLINLGDSCLTDNGSFSRDIHSGNGQITIHELSKRNFTTVRQLERNFKRFVGVTPKEYSNIIRFQNALALIKNPDESRSFFDIAFECGYYDHSHLTSEIKRNTGLLPSQL
ncbi:MAG: AraC family transcriptional regulator [Chitinophagaceae bacterium]|nr:MAG: AraC family transcriptional regulator [Chitinophagaceae bacterium]